MAMVRRGKGAYGVDVEIAGVENDRPVDVLIVEIFKSYVFDVAVADIRACPSLKTSTVLC